MDNVDVRVKGLEDKMQEVLKLLYGNGKPGLIKELADHKTEFRDFFVVWKAREQDKMKYDDEQKEDRIEQRKQFNSRLNIVIGIGGLIFIMVATVVAVMTYERASGHAILSPTRTSGIEGEQALEHAYKEWYAHNE